MLGYVTIKKFSELHGYTQEAIRAKIKKGIWIQGIHFIKSPDNRIQLIPQNIEKWFQGK